MDENIDKKKPITPIIVTSGPELRTARTMDFPDAIKELTGGRKIRRESWPPGDYGILKDGWVSIFREGTFFKHWRLNDGDLEGQDWVVVIELKGNNEKAN